MVGQTGSIANIRYLAEEKANLIDNCPKCGGIDFKCSCYAKYSIEVRKVRSNIPLKYRKASLSSIRSAQAAKPKEKIQTYVKNIKKNRRAGVGLYLWGVEGTAKTYLGTAVLIEALKLGYSAYFTTLTDCVDNIIRSRESFAFMLQNTTFLMIDDIGYAYKPIKDEITYVDSVIDKVLRKRCNDLLPNILTSHKNLTELALANQSGARMSAIVKEHMRRIQFSGKSFRDNIGSSLDNKG